jgi:hypothetical protein
VGELVFVDGAPGTGKSTTAQFLARQLARHGRPARWVYEEEVPNPFVPETPPAGARTWEDGTWDAWADAHVERWRAVARAAADTRETLVAESVLLQRPVFTMLRRDADRAAIEAVVNRFAVTVAPLNPTLVYLAHPDPERAWRAVMAKRGAAELAAAVHRSEEWPFVRSRGRGGLEGVIAYWRAHAALCDDIVSSLPMTTHMIDAAEGTWSERRARICACLGIPCTEPAVPAIDALSPCTGRYRRDGREITIDLEAGALVLRGALWPSNALLPVEGDLFDVEAWPLRVRFEPDGNGGRRALRWEGARLWWGGPEGVYTRVTG